MFVLAPVTIETRPAMLILTSAPALGNPSYRAGANGPEASYESLPSVMSHVPSIQNVAEHQTRTKPMADCPHIQPGANAHARMLKQRTDNTQHRLAHKRALTQRTTAKKDTATTGDITESRDS